jgi:hypothetical protein
VAVVADTAVFCISLQNSPRRTAFAAAAAAHSVAFEFVDAISPADLRQGFIMEDCRIDITDLRWTRQAPTDPRRQQAPLMFAEIGCAYSHMTCWRIGRARDLDHICVFEDDAVICRSFRGIDMPDAVDMLYLGERMPHDRRGEITGDGCGTEGYILSRAGIQKCLDIFRVLRMPIDLQLMAHLSHAVGGGRELNARVATRPYCRHPDPYDSQIYPSELQRAVAERDRLRLEVEALRRSTSWRLTAPARALKTAFARPPRGSG